MRLFLAFVPNLFVARAKWANVLVGLSAFMGTAPGDINSHCSCKAARFHQAETQRERNKCKVRRKRASAGGRIRHTTKDSRGRYCSVRNLNLMLYLTCLYFGDMTPIVSRSHGNRIEWRILDMCACQVLESPNQTGVCPSGMQLNCYSSASGLGGFRGQSAR